MLADVPRDEHGHIRLAEVPIARVLRTAVRRSAGESRGMKVAIGEKDVGYEVRCGYPTAFDRDYTRDLGVGAVRILEAGGSSVLITRQQGAIVPMPFENIVDPATGKSRVRGVDVTSDSYRSALALQERITTEDLADPARLEAIAERERGDGDDENLEEEFADVLAWLSTLANITGVDLTRAVERKYVESGGPEGTK